MSLSAYAENKIVDHVLGTAPWAAPAGAHVKLHIGDPGDSGAANVAVESSRRTALFGSSVNGSAALLGPLTWLAVLAAEIFTHVSVWDDLTAGNCTAVGRLTAPHSRAAGASFTINTLSVTAT